MVRPRTNFPDFYPNGISIGPNQLDDPVTCPSIVGIKGKPVLLFRNCHVLLDENMELTSTNLITTNLSVNGTLINKVTSEVSDPPELNSLLTLNGVTQYVDSKINSINPSPWVIDKDNIYYRNGAVGIGNLDPLILSSSKEGTGMIAVGKSLISINKSNLRLMAEGVQIATQALSLSGATTLSLEAKTTEIKSTTLKLIGSLQLGASESQAFNKITDNLKLIDTVNNTTLPTAKAVTDYVTSYVNDNSPGGKPIWKSSSNDNQFVYYSDGNVGIGTEDPKARLHVAKGAIMPSSGKAFNNGIVFPSDPGVRGGNSAWMRYYHVGGGYCTLEIGISNDNADGAWGDSIAIMPSGRLGIGTTQPTKALVEIANSVHREIGGGYNWLTGRDIKPPVGRVSNNDTRTDLFSLYADGRICGKEFNAHSDVRIKDIVGLSDASANLNTLLKIQVTDYFYKDRNQRGEGQYTKVVGQQIAKIFPQAVKMLTDVIPDIYRPANISGGWVQLPGHGLSVGERVRLFWKDSEPVIYNIEEASNDSFRVPLQFEGEIFVYGREVDDFHVVDYEAISMLHVSATQELYKIIQGLKQDVEDLKTQLATMNGTGLSPIAHA